jgi:hypothetical protein
VLDPPVDRPRDRPPGPSIPTHRRAGADSERARVRITRALCATLDRIGQHNGALEHHLRTCVRTGTFCVYEPGPDAAAWDTDVVD